MLCHPGHSVAEATAKKRTYISVRVAMLLAACISAAPLLAQTPAPKPAAGQATAKHVPNPWAVPPTSRFDIFGGYVYWKPSGTLENGNSFQAINTGFAVSGTYFFSKRFGATFDFADHPETSNDGADTFAGGLTYRVPTKYLTPFAHVMGGGAHFTGANVPTIGSSSFFYNPAKYGPLVMAGGGLDLERSWHHFRFGIRMIEADYQHLSADFGPIGPTSGGNAKLNALRLGAGVVLHFGNQTPLQQIHYSCSTEPSFVYPGQPVVITGEVKNADPRRPLQFSWQTAGGHLTSRGNTATIDTAHLAAGTYIVEGTVRQGSQPNERAVCHDGFIVRQYPEPTVKCSVNPERIGVGQPVAVHAEGKEESPYQLSYSFTASMGELQQNGDSAVLQTSTAQPGAIRVTCTVRDEVGRSASDLAIVVLDEPVAPPRPRSQRLCTLSFSRDKRRPTRVDNEAKACLDDIALSLSHYSDAKLVLIGQNDACDPEGNRMAEQRAVNAADYLEKEKSIDPSRIEVRLGRTALQQVDSYLVPTGADFNEDVPMTAPVPGSTIKPENRVPLPQRQHTSGQKPARTK